MASIAQLSEEDMQELRRSVADMVLRDLRKMQSENQNDIKKSRSLRDKLGQELPLTGLSDAVKAKRITAAIFWTLIFLVCVGATVYFVYKVISEYHAETTATKVKLERQAAYDFPSFVLCVDTWLDAEKAMQLGFTDYAIRYAMAYLIAPYEIYGSVLKGMWRKGAFEEDERPALAQYTSRSRIGIDASTLGKWQFERAYKRLNLTSLLEFFELISLDMVKDSTAEDEMSFECLFCKDSRPPKVIIGHDVCYKISMWSVDSKMGHAAGWYELTARVPDRTRGLRHRRSYWKLYVSQQMTKFIQPGTFMSIHNGHTHTVRVNTEHGISINTTKEPCIEDPAYSRRTCASDCVAQMVIDLKNCTLFNLDTNHQRMLSDYCNINQLDNWVDDVANEIITSLNITGLAKSNKEEGCLNACLPECDVWRYRTSVDTHRSHTLQTKADEHNKTAAKMFFVNEDVMAGGILTLTEVDTYSFETLISNIGGVCGIWIGASVLTFVQLFAFFSKLFLGYGKRHLKQKRSRSGRNEEAAMLGDTRKI